MGMDSDAVCLKPHLYCLKPDTEPIIMSNSSTSRDRSRSPPRIVEPEYTIVSTDEIVELSKELLNCFLTQADYKYNAMHRAIAEYHNARRLVAAGRAQLDNAIQLRYRAQQGEAAGLREH